MTLIDSLFFIPCLILIVLFIREIKKRGGMKSKAVLGELAQGVLAIIGIPVFFGLMCLIGYGYTHHMESIIVPHLIICLVGIFGANLSSKYMNRLYIAIPVVTGWCVIAVTVMTVVFGGIFTLCGR